MPVHSFPGTPAWETEELKTRFLKFTIFPQLVRRSGAHHARPEGKQRQSEEAGHLAVVHAELRGQLQTLLVGHYSLNEEALALVHLSQPLRKRRSGEGRRRRMNVGEEKKPNKDRGKGYFMTPANKVSIWLYLLENLHLFKFVIFNSSPSPSGPAGVQPWCKVNLHAMLQGWWDWPSLRCSAAPAQCQGGKCLYWLQGIADTEPVWATAAPPGAPEKHSTPGTWNTGSHCRFTLEQKLKPLHTISHKMFGLHSLLKTLCFFGPSYFWKRDKSKPGTRKFQRAESTLCCRTNDK